MKGAGGGPPAWAAALVLACLFLTTGCRRSSSLEGNDPTISSPSTSAVPTSTAATATTNPVTASTLVPLDQDPPVIDLAYAQRILDELNRLDGEAVRILHREKRVTPEVEAIMTAIYFGDALVDARQALATDLSLGLTTLKDPPSATLDTAIRIVSSRPNCIALLADSDSRPRYKKPVEVLRGIGILLQRNNNPTPEERRINPSLWVTTAGGTLIPGRNFSEACK